MDQSSPHQLAVILAEAKAHDGNGVAVIATDVNGSIVYWNDRAQSLYGWRPDEVIGRNIIDVTPTRQSADEAARIMERLRRGQAWVGTFIVERHDRTPLLVKVTDIPIRHEDEIIGVVGLSRRASPADPESETIG